MSFSMFNDFIIKLRDFILYIKLYFKKSKSPHYFLLKKEFKNFFNVRMFYHYYQNYNLHNKNKNLCNSEDSFIINMIRKIILRIIISGIFVLIIICLSSSFDNSLIYFLGININKFSSFYYDFLLAMLQLFAVFLGLYITITGVVFSTSYSTVTQNVRTLLLNDKLLKNYILMLSYAAGISLILILINNYRISVLAFIIILFLSLCSIFGFLSLFNYFFKLLSPNILLDNICNKIKNNIKSYSVSSNNFENKDFQNLNQKLAENYLNIINEIIEDISSNKKFKNADLVDIGIKCINLLQFYQNYKLRIPVNSFWFKLILKERDWTFYDYDNYNYIEIASETMTNAFPEQINEYYWFEKEIKSIINNILEILIDNNDLKKIEELIFKLKLLFFDFPDFLDTFNYLDLIKDNLLNYESNDGEINSLISILDIFGYLFNLNIINFFNQYSKYDLNYFNEIKSFDWNNQNKIYDYALPIRFIKTMDDFFQRLQFEIDVEDNVISSNDYLSEIIYYHNFNYIKLDITKIFNSFDKYIFDTIANLSLKDKILALPIIFRGLEALNKLDFDEIKSFYDQILENNIFHYLNLEEVNWKELDNKHAKFKNKLFDLLSDIIIQIPNESFSDDLPDYLGRSFKFLTEECYNMLQTGNLKRFNDLFPKVFILNFKVSDKIKSNDKFTIKSKNLIQNENLLKFINLSTYGILFSEVDSNDYWHIIKKVWEPFFTNDENSNIVKELYALIHSFSLITAQSIERTKWKLEFQNYLKKKYNLTDYYFDDLSNVDSKIIQNILKNGLSYGGDIEDHFLAKCIVEFNLEYDIDDDNLNNLVKLFGDINE